MGPRLRRAHRYGIPRGGLAQLLPQVSGRQTTDIAPAKVRQGYRHGNYGQ